ncbi:MarR family winged helix-turn-helix transcriptional regulator [Nocardia sp. alder85J]|uniref:MarR family winged helix-turn-helix transcriptional regulator n=1 Tax=Nocardia sp. alder85J TaxID=2862949 RepID=UPI001CD6420F|nr:MarR family transcriptional regulator [Nocardia sp. alder85J]MCX4092330.1 MarR family transcriptional regulator [Nocardia sp. alder85J]
MSSSIGHDYLSGTGRRWLELAAAYTAVLNSIERSIQQQIGIGYSDFVALRAVARADGGELRLQEVARETGLNQSSVSRLVDRLQRAGLTERRFCRQDRRGVYIGLTEAGAAVHRAAADVLNAALAAALADERAAGIAAAFHATD